MRILTLRLLRAFAAASIAIWAGSGVHARVVHTLANLHVWLPRDVPQPTQQYDMLNLDLVDEGKEPSLGAFLSTLQAFGWGRRPTITGTANLGTHNSASWMLGESCKDDINTIGKCHGGLPTLLLGARNPSDLFKSSWKPAVGTSMNGRALAIKADVAALPSA